MGKTLQHLPLKATKIETAHGTYIGHRRYNPNKEHKGYRYGEYGFGEAIEDFTYHNLDDAIVETIGEQWKRWCGSSAVREFFAMKEWGLYSNNKYFKPAELKSYKQKVIHTMKHNYDAVASFLNGLVPVGEAKEMLEGLSNEEQKKLILQRTKHTYNNFHNILEKYYEPDVKGTLHRIIINPFMFEYAGNDALLDFSLGFYKHLIDAKEGQLVLPEPSLASFSTNHNVVKEFGEAYLTGLKRDKLLSYLKRFKGENENVGKTLDYSGIILHVSQPKNKEKEPYGYSLSYVMKYADDEDMMQHMQGLRYVDDVREDFFDYLEEAEGIHINEDDEDEVENLFDTYFTNYLLDNWDHLIDQYPYEYEREVLVPPYIYKVKNIEEEEWNNMRLRHLHLERHSPIPYGKKKPFIPK